MAIPRLAIYPPPADIWHHLQSSEQQTPPHYALHPHSTPILTLNVLSKVADDHPHKLVALKIQKSAAQYTEAAEDEIDLLSTCQKLDPAGDKFVVGLLDNFVLYGPHGKRKWRI